MTAASKVSTIQSQQSNEVLSSFTEFLDFPHCNQTKTFSVILLFSTNPSSNLKLKTYILLVVITATQEVVIHSFPYHYYTATTKHYCHIQIHHPSTHTYHSSLTPGSSTASLSYFFFTFLTVLRFDITYLHSLLYNYYFHLPYLSFHPSHP